MSVPEVGGHASVPLLRDVRVRAGTDVCEASVPILEEGAPRQSAALSPGLAVRVRERVDGEEIEPAVVVVVEPAQTSAHHRMEVVRHPEAEVVLAKVEPDLSGDVRQPHTCEIRRRRVLHRGSLDRRGYDGRGDAEAFGDHVAPVVELHAHCRLKRPGCRSVNGYCRRSRVGGRLLEPAQPGDGDGRLLARSPLEPDVHPLDAVGGRRQPSARSAVDRPLLEPIEIGEQVARDLVRRGPAQRGLNAPRRQDRDPRQLSDLPYRTGSPG